MSFRSHKDGSHYPVHTHAVSEGIQHPGSLEAHDYHLTEPESERHEALSKAVRQDGYSTTAERLIALQVLNKNRNPDLSRRAKEDHEYIQKKYRGD